MMTKKKILIFLQNGVGGAERMSVLIGKGLDRREFDVMFCLVERCSKTSIADFIPQDYTIIRVPNAKPLKMMWQLFKVIKKENPHIVFSSVMYLNTKILPFRQFFPATRFVVRCENYLYTFSKKQKQFIDYTYHKADAIIAQTEEMRNELVEQMRIDSKKVTVMHNPVDTQLIDRLVEEGGNPYPSDGKKHYVAVGRFAYQKGYDLLMQAFCKVAIAREDVDLYIVGDKDNEQGKVFSEIMLMAQDYSIAERVHCVGYQKNPYRYILHADCFVLSSRWEGLPNVLIEAQYLGTPAAAFKCIPIVERILAEGKNGFLAEKDDIDSLAIAMRKAIGLGRIESSYRAASLEEFDSCLWGGGNFN